MLADSASFFSSGRTLVIVPTYSEIANLPRLVREVLDSDVHADVLVIDDNSPDGTGLLADRLAATTPRVHVLHRPAKLGLGTAYVAGFRWALERGFQRIVEMDADFSHRPEDLQRLLEAVEFADVVVGSRFVASGRDEGRSPVRRFISRVGSFYARTLLGLPISDCTSGYKCFRARALAALDLENIASNGFGFQVEVNFACHRHGLRMVEVPIVFPERSAGKSKMSFAILVEAAYRTFVLSRQRFRQASDGVAVKTGVAL
jgi:dolichol-phosphate mannosyltransferase